MSPTTPPPAAVVGAPRDDDGDLAAIRALTRRRSRIGGALTAAMVTVYFGFLALVAWRPALLATRLHEGLSLGILLGALVIVAAWFLTLVYVRWANAVYDPALHALRDARGHGGGRSGHP
jgi:uncharacterized membrane protein (DUF485 family)